MAIDFNSQAFEKSSANENGWRDLVATNRTADRTSLKGGVAKSLLNLVHISDTHICDAQSPARVEYLDRFADPHHPVSSVLGALVGTYRSNEILTAQVLESMIQSINRLDAAPISGRAIDAVIVTGDLTDNAQHNELNWFTTLMHGGKLRPDSGSFEKWEGPGGDFYSPFFWNPHGTPVGELEDFPRKLYGYPTIPELLDAVRAPFYATGLKYMWLAVHGNHDALLQGTVVPDEVLRGIAVSGVKIVELTDEEAIGSLQQVSQVGPASYPGPLAPITAAVAPDLDRDFVIDATWHQNFGESNQPFTSNAHDLSRGKKYWRKDYEGISLIALDTVNPFGGWQGSIDQAQFEWLKQQVEELKDRYVVITSHHPVQDIFNGYTPHTEPRVLGAEIEAYLVSQPHVVAWICGHTHRHKVQYFGPDRTRGFWQIETSSLVDWPQQGRVIEFFINHDDELCIASTTLEHDGALLPDYSKAALDEVNNLSGLSRLLSLNDWQRRPGAFAIEENEGEVSDRDFLVTIAARIKER